jgi:PTS system nitrogen regulatory IIA component
MEQVMTLEEVAAHLRVSERTVTDWVSRGEMPGGKLGTSWRFLRSEIDSWLTYKLSPRIKSSTPTTLPIATILQPNRCLRFNHSTKAGALGALAHACSDVSGVNSTHELTEALFRREQLMSTGIGLGIGVPHVRLNTVSSVSMAVGVSEQPLTDYESLDGLPIRIVVLIIAGREQHTHYIKVLANISRLLRVGHVREQILAAGDSESIYSILATQSAS